MKWMTKPPDAARNRDFYERLLNGRAKRHAWGKATRFDGISIATKPSVQRFFVDVVRPFFTGKEQVLDLGCGPGGFLAALAPLCERIVGVDIVAGFVTECQDTIRRAKVPNATTLLVPPEKLPFSDSSFDAVVLVDTVHHLDDIEQTLSEAFRVLRKSGRLLVFEPNRLNPLLALMCLLDRNERGLLALGTKARYRYLMKGRLDIERLEYNGLLIGFENKLFLGLAHFLSQGIGARLFGWMSPKIVVVGKKR